MDWEALSERSLGEVGEALVTEGGGVAVGFVGASFLGRQIQNLTGQTDANIAGNLMNAVTAWSANNIPKLLAWYFTRKYAIEPGETGTPIREAVSDARKAFAGSVVFDTLMRLANGGSNPASASIMGWQVLGSGNGQVTTQAAQADVQRLIQENSALRTELNKALQRLATQHVAPPVIQQPQQPMVQQPIQPAPAQMPTVVVQPAPAPAPVVRYTPVTPYSAVPPYGSPIPPYSVPAPRPVAQSEEIYTQPTPPAVQERQRRYGSMVTPPHVQERQRKYSFMADNEKEIAAAFGML